VFREKALAALDAGDVIGFLICADNQQGLGLVFYNSHLLKSRGLYEEALLGAWTGCRVNNLHYLRDVLQRMWERADREVLRRLAPPPGPGPFTLYRGIAGNGKTRRIRGLSWTADRKEAQWFAQRFPCLAKPRVYTITIGAESVYAHIKDRNEAEFVVRVPPDTRLKKVELLPTEEGIVAE
jgi:hypothetical protein